MPRTHKNLPRIFVNAELVEGSDVTLDRDQMHHLVHVLRRGEEDECVLFNGRQGAFRSRIVEVRKKFTRLELIARIAEQPAAPGLWFGFAPLKTGRLDYLVQKATEMGVGTLQPVRTAYTQQTRLRVEKMVAHTVEAAQQCEVLNLPELAEEISIDQLLDQWADAHGDRQLVFADEELASASPVESLMRLGGRRIGLLIGPEGGFSDAEREKLRLCTFVHPISLGPRVLRADTAAVAALGLIQATIGDWR